MNMIAVNGWCAVEKGDGKGKRSWDEGSAVQTFFNRFLKTLPERAATVEAGSLFQYSATLNENVDPLLRRLLASWSTLKRCSVRVHRARGRRNKFKSKSKMETVDNVMVLGNRSKGNWNNFMRWQVYRLARLIGKVVRVQHRGGPLMSHWWWGPFTKSSETGLGYTTDSTALPRGIRQI